MAHNEDIQVVPLVGPSSILLALMASGMNGQSFAFNGYLPIEKSKRKKKLQNLEKNSRNHNQTQIFIETPSATVTLFEMCNISSGLIVKSDSIVPPLMWFSSVISSLEVTGENRTKNRKKLINIARNLVAINLPKYPYVFKMFSNLHLSNPFCIQKY